MNAGNQKGSMAMLHQANNSFKNVAPYITKSKELQEYFKKTYNDFGAVLATGEIPKINDYMISVHKAFQQAAEGI